MKFQFKQAFNARGSDARRIYDKIDDFSSRKPIDVIKANRPIIILDEPQKMGPTATQVALKEFNPLFTLNYSATHAKLSLARFYGAAYRFPVCCDDVSEIPGAFLHDIHDDLPYRVPVYHAEYPAYGGFGRILINPIALLIKRGFDKRQRKGDNIH